VLVRERIGFLFQRSVCLLQAAVLMVGLVLGVISFAQETARKVIARTAPSYPELAKKMHLSGKAKVEVLVNAAGTVMSAKFVGGNPVFETSAVEAVKQWKFEPSAGPSKGTVVVEFADQ